jgi:hypothetical protein
MRGSAYIRGANSNKGFSNPGFVPCGDIGADMQRAAPTSLRLLLRALRSVLFVKYFLGGQTKEDETTHVERIKMRNAYRS